MLATKIRAKKLWGSVILSMLLTLAPVSMVRAVCSPDAQTCSTNYKVTESFFGNGGQYSCSSSYCANQSSGEQTVGKSCDPSDSKCIQAGFNTNRIPFLEMIVNTPSVDVGVLDTAETHVGTASFQVKSYLAHSYQVTTVSPGPQNGTYHMISPGLPAASSVGTEQFGMNVVANSCPVTAPSTGLGSCTSTLGVDPDQVPDSTFSFGYAATNYDTPDTYVYNDGDIIARSDSSSGTTVYTISYIFNISNVTPGGTYTMDQSLVATSTF